MLKAINILKHERFKVIVMIFMVITVGFVMTNAVTAQSIIIEEPNNCEGAGCLGFDAIQIPTFLELPEIRSFSIGSYIAVAFNFVFVGLALLWVGLVIRAGVGILSSQGSEDALVAAKDRITNVFASISILFGFLVVLLFVASIFGLGQFWRWPQYLSFCDDGRIYYAHVLEVNPVGASIAASTSVEDSCYGGGGGGQIDNF